MNRIFRLWGVSFLGCLFVACGARASDPPANWTASLDEPAPAYLLGAPMPIGYTYTRVLFKGYLEMNHLGVADLCQFVMTDAQGKVVPPPPPPDGFLWETNVIPPREDLYRIYPEDSVQLVVDLKQLFDIKAAGAYTLSLCTGVGAKVKFDEVIINVLAMETSGEPPAITGACSHPVFGAGPQDVTPTNYVPVECRVDLGLAGGPDRKAAWYVRIEHEMQFADGTHVGNTIGCPIRPAKLIQAELDCAWQVWMILESEKEAEWALLVFDLRSGKQQTLVPWGSRQQLTLGATRAQRIGHAKIVIGGKIGETQFSTYTVSQSGGWRNPYEPPPITEQPASEEASPDLSTPTIEPAETTAP